MTIMATQSIVGSPIPPPPYAMKDGQGDTPTNYDIARISILPHEDFKISDLLELNKEKNVEKTSKDEKPYIVTDGKDDGSIGFGEACKNLFNGACNFFKSMVCDEDGKFSINKTLKTVAIAAAVTVGAVAFPVLGTALAIFAVGMGAKDIISAGIDIANAKTDKDAALAWQNMGSGLTEEAIAVIGAKKMGAFDDIATMGGMIKRGEYSELLQHVTKFNMPSMNFIKSEEFTEGVTENTTTNATGREETLKAAYKGAVALGSSLAGMFADK